MLHPVRFGKRLIKKAAGAIDAPVVVLLYHRVASLEKDNQLLAVSEGRFSAHLRHIKENFNIVRFDGDWSNIKKPSVAITFDDGYADNFLNALPLLAEAQAHATFFATSGMIGAKKEFWWDELEAILFNEEAPPGRLDLKSGDLKLSCPSGTGAEKKALYLKLQPLMKNLFPLKREGLLDELRRWAGVRPFLRESHRPMTVQELRVLAKSTFASIGSHGITHTPFSVLSPEDQRLELEGSKKEIEQWIGKEVLTFSYPFGGRPDYTKDSPLLCKNAGYIRAAANTPGQAHSWTGQFEVPRHIVRDWGLDEFRKRLNGFFQ
ncbi:MAG: polysaccharide deacetylase family protein [Deltaproteobacteria bacterium]